MVLAREEELLKAQAEAWSKTHYRTDWLLARTLGYSILCSTLAIYVFWAETGHDHPTSVLFGLSCTWMLLQGLALLWYDFRTRVSYEKWAEVRTRLFRHLWVSVVSFLVALLIAFSIHGLAFAIDSMTPAPNTTTPAAVSNFLNSNKLKYGPNHHTSNAGKKARDEAAHAKLVVKTPAKKPATTTSKPNASKPTATAKPAAKNPVKPAAKAPAKKTPAKKVVKKAAEWHPPMKKKHHRRIF